MLRFNGALRTVAALVALIGGVTVGVAAAAQAGVPVRLKHSGKLELKRHHRGRGRNRRGNRGRRALELRALHGELLASRMVIAQISERRHKRPPPTTTTPTTTTPTTSTPTTTTPTTTTPTTTTPTTTTPTTTTPTSTTPQPDGMSGNWTLTFDDEFNGTSLNTSAWSDHDGWANQNNVTDHTANVLESGGDVTLTLASSTSGAAIQTNVNLLNVGDFAEARVYFAGSGTTIYDWPAWWVSGPNWPASGESDIAEGLGTLTVNYHSPSGAHNTGTVPGIWANAFHTYGIYRGSNYCDVYYDGQLVRHYSTDDNGAAEALRFTIGAANILQFGISSQMKVDYARVWAPA